MACAVAVQIAIAGSALAHPQTAHDIEKISIELAKSPDRVDLLLRRAQGFEDVGRLPEALSDLDRAARADAGSRLVALKRGLLLAALGRGAEAEAEFNRYFASGGTSERALIERAKIRHRSGRLESAIADYSAALETVDDLDAYLGRGRIQEQLGRLADAAAGYRRGLERMPNTPELQVALVAIEVRRKEYAAARSVIDSALAAAAVKTEWYLRRAEVSADLGETGQAEADRLSALREAERVFGLRPSSVNRLARARALIALGRYVDARADLQAVLAESPHQKEAGELLARIGGQERLKP